VAIRGPLQACFYHLWRSILFGPVVACTRVRYFNVPNLRRLRCGVMLVSNHQSFLDPVLVGIAMNEVTSYLARQDLFRIPVFGAIIRALGAHPVARGRVDRTALRTVVRLMQEGERLLVFPEGTRAWNGLLGRFRTGAAALAIRMNVPVLPVAVEGAFACWPRTQMLPRPGRVAVAYGELIYPCGQSPAQLTQRLREEIDKLQAFLREWLGYNATAGRPRQEGRKPEKAQRRT
jgi:1-acyl-sn-glycerol-3-phosphate acyltransferase